MKQIKEWVPPYITTKVAKVKVLPTNEVSGMKRYDLKISRENGTCLSIFDSVDKGEYVKHEDVQKMLIEIRSTAFIQGYKKMIDTIIEKEGFEVKE